MRSLGDSLGASANDLLRRGILGAVESRRVAGLVERYGMQLGARRFVAGETLDECVQALRALNDRGLRANTTLLGEGVESAGGATAVAREYESILRRIDEERLRANVALKLTNLGLAIDEDLAHENVARVVDCAGALGNFVRIDMEESRYVDATLRIYGRLRADGRDNVGTVLQAYLYRSLDDLRSLLPLRPNLRLVKGAYLEPADTAYPAKKDVDANYVRLLELALTEGSFTAVATHDERILDHVIGFARRHGIESGERFEFQMLYGVRPQLQLDLVRRGYPVLVATPFGPEWYAYLMRRLAERPANLLFLLRNLLRA